MISTTQACSNAEEEVLTDAQGDSVWDWDVVQQASVNKWEDVLQRVVIDTVVEDPTIVELLYSSVRPTSS